jgi:hypothetical protein
LTADDSIEGRLSAAGHAMAADPGPVLAVLERHAGRLARDGIDLPFAGDRLPLTPAVLPGSWAARLQDGCRAMFSGIEAIFAGAFAGDAARLADYLLFAPEERALLGVGGTHDWAATARPDFMAGGSGPAIIESNISTSLGLLEAGLLAPILADIPVIGDLIRTAGLTTAEPARALARSVAASLPAPRGSLVVFTDWRDQLPLWNHLYRYLGTLLAPYGIDSVPCALDDLDIRADRVLADGRRADVIYRFYTTTRLPDPRFAALHEPLLAAIASGRVALFGAYAHKIFTPKLFLALLSDERFSSWIPEAAGLQLRDVLPWTRIVEDRATLWRGRRVDLLDCAARNRAGLVLKPNLGYGGAGVTVGRDVGQAEWEDKLSAALRVPEHWLLQEVIPSQFTDLPFAVDGQVELRPARVDYGAFMIDRRLAGVARRNTTARSGPTLTNVSRGGGLSPVYFAA